MPGLELRAFAAATVLSGMLSVVAQSGSAAFMWGWLSDVESIMVECSNYSIFLIEQGGSFGTPPYYMIAWPSEGVPTVSLIGSNASDLTYQVNQPAGSTVMVSVADAEGNTGGQAGTLYSIQNGSSECLPPTPKVTVSLFANVSTSDDLNVCQPLGLRISGGQKPYNISIAGAGKGTVFNTTLGANDDIFTWPNTIPAGIKLIVSASDANGVWANDTGFYLSANSDGADPTNCPLQATSGNSTTVEQHPSESEPHHSLLPTLVGAIVGSVVGVLLLILVGIVIRRHMLELAATAAEQRRMGPEILSDTASMSGRIDPWGPSSRGPRTSRLLNMLPPWGPPSPSATTKQTSNSSPRQGMFYHSDAGVILETPPPYQGYHSGVGSSRTPIDSYPYPMPTSERFMSGKRALFATAGSPDGTEKSEPALDNP